MHDGRVLIDVPHDPGVDVLLCHGPKGGEPCPLLTADRCGRFEEASAIVFGLALDVAEHRAILRRYRELAPALPITVITSDDLAAEWADLLDGCTVITREPIAPIALEGCNLPSGGC